MIDDVLPEDDALQIWTIYDHPADEPEWYLARMFRITPQGAHPTGTTMTAKDVGMLRRMFQMQGLTCLMRNEEDEPSVMESWL